MRIALAAAAAAALVASAAAAPLQVLAHDAPDKASEPTGSIGGSGSALRNATGAPLAAARSRTLAEWLTSALYTSPLSCAQSSSEWWLRQYRVAFGQEGEAAVRSAVASLGVGVVGGVPRLFLVFLFTMISMVLVITIWSIATEGKDPNDPFSLGARGQIQLGEGAYSGQHRPQPGPAVRLPRSAAPQSQSSAAAQGSGLAAPPLCPALILPHGVAQFRIPVDSLHNLRDGTFPVPILGPSGLPVLHAWLPRGAAGSLPSAPGGLAPGGFAGPAFPGIASDRRWLLLTTTTTSRHPHAKVGPIALHSLPEEPIEIKGPGGDTYGILQCGDTGWGAMHNGQLVLFIDTTFPYPHLNGFSADGRALATAAHSRGRTDKPDLHGSADMIEALEVSAKPGSDALLALLCMLAVVLMSPKFSTLGSHF